MRKINRIPGGSEREKLSSFSNLIADVEKNNSDHGWGASLAKAIGRVVTKTVEGKEPDLSEEYQRGETESTHEVHGGLTSLRAKHERTLDDFGLTIKQSGEREVAIKLVKPTRLVERLREIRRRGDDSEEILKSLAGSITRQIYMTDFENILPEDKKVIENLPVIAEELRKADEKLDLKEIEIYTRFQKEDRLTNYVLVERDGLWQEPGEGFGPADWIKDITAGHLNKKWLYAVGVLQRQEALHNSGVAIELRSHLLKCIASASETLKTLGQKGYPEYYLKGLQPVLEKYTKELRGNNALN